MPLEPIRNWNLVNAIQAALQSIIPLNGPLKMAAILVSLTGCSFNGAPGRVFDAGVSDAPADAGSVDSFPCAAFEYGNDPTVIVGQDDDLAAALLVAADGAIIEVSGTHIISAKITNKADNLIIRGKSGSRPIITIAENINGLRLEGSGVSLFNLEFRGGKRQLEIRSVNSIRSMKALVYDVIFRKPTERGILIRDSDDSVILCSQFVAPAGSCPNNRGVEVRDSNKFRAAKNLFSGFDCDDNAIGISVRNSTDPFIERNRFDGFAYAMRVGISTQEDPEPCDPSGQNGDVNGGILCNNLMIGRSETRPARGILFLQACAITVVHNTVYGLSNKPRAFQIHESNSLVIAANNLSNGIVDLSKGMVDSHYQGSNQYNAPDTSFADAPAGKLTPVANFTQMGNDISELANLVGKCDLDFEGRVRSLSSPQFVGAYEVPAL